MVSAIKLKQNSYWQLYAVVLKSYDDGTIYTEAIKLLQFKDLSKEYMTVVYKHTYNGMLQIKRTDKTVEATKIYAARYQTLSTTHACVITASNDNDAIKSVQGRSGYRVWVSDGNLLLVKPKGIYLG